VAAQSAGFAPAMKAVPATDQKVGSSLRHHMNAEEQWIYAVVIGAILVLLAAFILLILGTRMLRDEQTGLYNPGKSEMAFWGFLVALTFIGVWILTGTMARIPAQALMLLGISAGTGLSAILIGR
jgi:hypothetical protein